MKKRNAMVKKLFLFSAKHPLKILILLFSFSILSIPFIKDIKLDNDFNKLLSKNSTLWSNINQYEKDFNNSSDVTITGILIQDSTLISSKKLTSLKRFVQEIEQIKGVKVDSIFNQLNYQMKNDDLNINYFFDEINEKTITTTLPEIKKSIFTNNIFINLNKKTALIKIFTSSRSTNEEDKTTRKQLDNIINKYQPSFQNIHVFGHIYQKTELAKVILETAIYPTMIALCIIVIILSLACQTPLAGLIVLLGSIISTLFSLVVFKLIGLKLTLFTCTTPLLIVVIGACEDCYITTHFLNFKRKRFTGDELFNKTINKCSKSILLALITTIVSFLESITRHCIALGSHLKSPRTR